ncbi:MAG: PilZ domain-containing protein [Phycisphaeraceae bacterium]|nr:PilZ domain-containing protein [Phycisphaeraceae bacterium]
MHGTECEIAPTPLRFERRRSERLVAAGSAVAVFHRPGRSPLLSSVRLADASPGGLGVYFDSEIKPGTSFRLYPDDPSQPRRAGRVVGCVRVGKAFRLGLQFQQAIAA